MLMDFFYQSFGTFFFSYCLKYLSVMDDQRDEQTDKVATKPAVTVGEPYL